MGKLKTGNQWKLTTDLTNKVAWERTRLVNYQKYIRLTVSPQHFYSFDKLKDDFAATLNYIKYT